MEEKSKKTLIIGASENPERYSNKAAFLLLKHNHPIFLVGNKEGEIAGHKIHKEHIQFTDINTVTLYINSSLQPNYYEYILSLKPQRVIFNPGTENPEFEKLLTNHDIEAVEACTLVMLSIGVF